SAAAVIHVLSGVTLTAQTDADGALAASIQGAGSLVKTGSATLTLTGVDALTGGTTVSTGTLRIGDGGTSGSGTGDVRDNATLTFDRSDSVSYGGVLSGTGTVVKAGAGTLTLTAANTYSGGTVISTGTLQTSNSSGLGSGTVTLGDADTGSADVAFLAA